MQRTRKSRQREEILAFLQSTDTHPTAQQIYERLLPHFPSLSLGTVYRNLAILEKQGLVQRLRYGSTFDRYDAATHRHYHFICRRCETVYDLDLEIDPAVAEKADEISGHRVESHSIDFYGICRRCIEEEKVAAAS